LTVTATTDPRETSNETAYIASDGALNSDVNLPASAIAGTFSLVSDPQPCGATLHFSAKGSFYACGALQDVSARYRPFVYHF
jgi:hypothetical protein